MVGHLSLLAFLHGTESEEMMVFLEMGMHNVRAVALITLKDVQWEVKPLRLGQ